MWKFLKSSTNKSNWLDNKTNEICFVGRSNVGKSSLINILANNKKLSRISKTPGRTRLVNFFITTKNQIIVDLPGYGYAKVSKTKKQEIETMIFEYLRERKNLKFVFILIDSKVGFTNLDEKIIHWIKQLKLDFKIIFTKNDKSNQSERYRNNLFLNKLNIKSSILISKKDHTNKIDIYNIINKF